jgi:Skp family chaperone for outer membrane proteins
MEMRRTHKQELDRLHQEKDQLLKEEAQATQAVLDAMRKAHEAELQKERSKFLDLIAKTYCQADMESLQRQHEEDLELIQQEIGLLSEQYSIKCLENAALTERLDAQGKALHANCLRVHDLLSRNEQLSSSFKYELERLGRMVEQQASNLSNGNQDPKQLNDQLHLKEAEILQLQQELCSVKYQMDIKTEELAECQRMYSRLHTLVNDNNSAISIDSLVPSHDTADASPVSLSRNSVFQGSFSSLDPFDASLDESVLLNKLAACRRSSSNSYRLMVGSNNQFEHPGDSALSACNSSPRDTGRRRLHWRFTNPQRARTSPDVLSSSFRSSSTDVKTAAGENHVTDQVTSCTVSRPSLRSSESDSDVASTAF